MNNSLLRGLLPSCVMASKGGAGGGGADRVGTERVNVTSCTFLRFQGSRGLDKIRLLSFKY